MNRWREFLNNNPAVVTILAVLLLIGALFFIIQQMRGPGAGHIVYDAYFYDLGTKQLFVDKAAKIPPFDTPSGKNMGVRAYVYGCGDCAEANRFIGYLQCYSEEYKKKREEEMQKGAPGPEAEYIDESMHSMVRRVEGGKWEASINDEAMKITDITPSRCSEGRRLVVCIPGKK